MPAKVTTRAQVNGYRFLIRRLEHALIRGDSRMIHDPMRGQMRSLIVGLVIGVLIIASAAIMAFFKPTPNMGDAQILVSKSNGAIFVRIGDRVHPALNLASARLIAGKSDAPKEVDDKFLHALPRGSLVGTIGAPQSIHAGDDMEMSSWTVCDTTQTPKVTETVGATGIETTVLANPPVLSNDIRAAAPEEMFLTQSGDTVFLIYDGVRAPIDVTNPMLISALHLENAEVRTVSPGLLNAFPLADPILPVTIPGNGDVPSYLPAKYRVGSILSASDSRGEQLYVVLHEGLQPISEATADIIRYSDSDAIVAREPKAVPPALVAEVPVVRNLPVDHYPAASPKIVSLEPDRVVCMAWERANNAAKATTRLLVGHRLPLSQDAQQVRLASADGNGPGLDSVYLKPGTGEYVQATGGEPDSRAMGQLFYISDTGVRFHVKDLPTAAALGVKGVKDVEGKQEIPQAAPWPVIMLLPPGPELSQQAALIAHDGMPADPNGITVNPPAAGSG
jgi:type VII secretion protein EccB